MDADPSGKVLAALDRLAHARRTWRQTFATDVGLTPLQIDLLGLLQAAPPAPVVGALATEIGVSQPTVTDSVRALEHKGLLRRDPDPLDARRSLLALTADGRRIAARATAADHPFREAFAALPARDVECALEVLLTAIAHLVEVGAVTVARTCTTCRFHRLDDARHHCTLLGTDLPVRELRVNCADHQRGFQLSGTA